MQIQLNTDHNISGSPRLKDYVEAQVNDALGRFSDRLTRVEVHLNDVNSDKSGPNDKRCMMEARIRNHQPLSVTHEAAEFGQAVDGAASKLTRALDHLFGRLGAQRRDGRQSAKAGDTLLAEEDPLADDSPPADTGQLPADSNPSR